MKFLHEEGFFVERERPSRVVSIMREILRARARAREMRQGTHVLPVMQRGAGAVVEKNFRFICMRLAPPGAGHIRPRVIL